MFVKGYTEKITILMGSVCIILRRASLEESWSRFKQYFSPCRDKLYPPKVVKPQRKALWRVNLSWTRLTTVPFVETIGMCFVVSQTILSDKQQVTFLCFLIYSCCSIIKFCRAVISDILDRCRRQSACSWSCHDRYVRFRRFLFDRLYNHHKCVLFSHNSSIDIL